MRKAHTALTLDVLIKLLRIYSSICKSGSEWSFMNPLLPGPVQAAQVSQDSDVLGSVKDCLGVLSDNDGLAENANTSTLSSENAEQQMYNSYTVINMYCIQVRHLCNCSM